MGYGSVYQPSRVQCGVCGLTYVPHTTSRHWNNNTHIAAARARGIDPGTLDPQPLICAECGGRAGWKGHYQSKSHQASIAGRPR